MTHRVKLNEFNEKLFATHDYRKQVYIFLLNCNYFSFLIQG